MSEEQANAVAAVYKGRAWRSGGGIWLVIAPTDRGTVVVFSDDLIAEYRSEADFHAGEDNLADVSFT